MYWCIISQLLQLLSVLYLIYCRHWACCISFTTGTECAVSQLLQLLSVLYFIYCMYWEYFISVTADIKCTDILSLSYCSYWVSCISFSAGVECVASQLLQLLSVLYLIYCRYWAFCISVTAGIECTVSQLLQVLSALCYQLQHLCITRANQLVVYRYSNPFPGLHRPWGFQEVEAPIFQDSRHLNVLSLSDLGSGPLYPSENIPGTHFCYKLSRPLCHMLARRFCRWKIPVTPSGIEPTTFRFVAQCLKRY